MVNKGELSTIRSLINVASQINVALYKIAKINKRSLLNKRSSLEIENKEEKCRPIFVHKTILLFK